jgi:hypothetical protein
MTIVRLRRKLDSETLHIPELKSFLGKTVDIIIEEGLAPQVTPGTGDWDALEAAADDLEGYDFDAVGEQREYDREHAEDHLP